jgi:hypothetical protein
MPEASIKEKHCQTPVKGSKTSYVQATAEEEKHQGELSSSPIQTETTEVCKGRAEREQGEALGSEKWGVK